MQSLIMYGCINQMKLYIKKDENEFVNFIKILNPIINFKIKEKFLKNWIDFYIRNEELFLLIKEKKILRKKILLYIAQFNLIENYPSIHSFLPKNKEKIELLVSTSILNESMNNIIFLFDYYVNFDFFFENFFLLRYSIYVKKENFITFLLSKVKNKVFIESFLWNLLKKSLSNINEELREEITNKITHKEYLK